MATIWAHGLVSARACVPSVSRACCQRSLLGQSHLGVLSSRCACKATLTQPRRNVMTRNSRWTMVLWGRRQGASEGGTHHSLRCPPPGIGSDTVRTLSLSSGHSFAGVTGGSNTHTVRTLSLSSGHSFTGVTGGSNNTAARTSTSQQCSPLGPGDCRAAAADRRHFSSGPSPVHGADADPNSSPQSQQRQAHDHQVHDLETYDLDVHNVELGVQDLGMQDGEARDLDPDLGMRDLEARDLDPLPPARPIEPRYSLAPFLAQSPVLQGLVGVGVDLSALEKVGAVADFLVQAHWERDVVPTLLFLRDAGVAGDQVGAVLTRNPLLLTARRDHMQMCVSYLQSKRFSDDQIGRIVTHAPLTLLLPVNYVDMKLGFLQNKFQLLGDEVRYVATKLPKILPWRLQKLKDIQFYAKEMLGFSNREQKAMLLACPKLYLSSRHHLGERFDFLHGTMGLTHANMAAWPSVLRARLHTLQQRHRFLVLVERAQYDPERENYVSLQALVSGHDQHFCSTVAKTSTANYHNFLKTL